MPMDHRRLSHSLASLGALVVLMASAAITDARAEAPAIYMQRVANQLIAASRTGSQSAFAAALRSHGHLPTIGRYALGQYEPRLKSQEDKQLYYSAMVRWISRYVAGEALKNPVASAVVTGQTAETKKGATVFSKITMKSGATYDVNWWVFRDSGGALKVGDAEVLGMSARDQLRTIFEDFLSKNGGNPQKLVMALNQ